VLWLKLHLSPTAHHTLIWTEARVVDAKCHNQRRQSSHHSYAPVENMFKAICYYHISRQTLIRNLLHVKPSWRHSHTQLVAADNGHWERQHNELFSLIHSSNNVFEGYYEFQNQTMDPRIWKGRNINNNFYSFERLIILCVFVSMKSVNISSQKEEKQKNYHMIAKRAC
jgi:hypothetical protein